MFSSIPVENPTITAPIFFLSLQSGHRMIGNMWISHATPFTSSSQEIDRREVYDHLVSQVELRVVITISRYLEQKTTL